MSDGSGGYYDAMGNYYGPYGDPTTTSGRAGGQPNESIQTANAQGKVVTGASAPAEPKSTWRWWAHTILGVGEFIPGVSTIAGAANAGLYLQEGEYGEAAMSALSTAPGGKIVALGAKGIKLAREARAAGKIAEEANAARKAADEANAGRRAAKEAEDAKKAKEAQDAKRAKEAEEAKKNKDGDSVEQKKKKEKEECMEKCAMYPVGLSTGSKITFDIDFSLPGVLPIDLARSYASDMNHDGPLGRNRVSALDETLSIQPDGSVLYRMASGMTGEFERPTPNVGEISYDERRSYLGLSAGHNRSFVVHDRALRKRFAAFPDAVWRLVELRDLNDHRATLTRDATGFLTRLDRSDGFSLLFENDEMGLRASVTLRAPSGETRPISRYAYDARGNLAEVRNAYTPSFRYEYDAANRFVAYEDGIKVRNAYAYDEAGRVVRVTTPNGAFDHTLTYGPEARTTRLAYAARSDATTDHVFDENHKTLAETDGLGNTRTFERNAFGTLLAETDAEGGRTIYGYDAFGNRNAITDPEGRRTLYHHDVEGRLEALVDPDGNAWEWRYDARGNLVSVRDPMGHRTDLANDAAGLPTGIMRHDGLIEKRTYDAQNRLIRLVDYRGGVTELERDAFGRVVAVTDPFGHATRYGFEERPGADFWTATAITRPDGVTMTRSVEPNQASVTIVDGEGRRTVYRYGPFDLLEEIADSKGGRLRFAYDHEQRLVRVESQLGRVWRFERDAAGRVVSEIDFSGLETGYAYDKAGRLTETRHADDSRVAFSYDRAGLLLREEAWAPGADEPDVTRYRYDGRGMLAEARNAATLVRFERDRLGRVVAEILNGRRIESAYDCCGNRLERRIGERLVASLYDPLGAAREIAIGGHAPLRFARDAAGRETGRESAAGFQLEQAWDVVGQLARQRGGRDPSGRLSAAPSPGIDRSYAWDRAFAPMEIADGRWGATTYGTDSAGQITQTRHGDGGSERFSYDPALSLDGSGADEERVRFWQVAPGGRVERARGPLGETIHLSYDLRLRVVERRVERDGFRPKVWCYGWDAQDRLVSCETPSGATWAYAYDPFGRRVSKRRVLSEAEQVWVRGRFPALVRSVSSGGRSALDVWPARPPGAGDLDAEPPVVGVAYSWDGDVVAEEAPLRLDGCVAWEAATRWHYEPGSFAPLAKEGPDGLLSYVVTDHLGTPRELFREDGALVWAMEHRTWGAPRRLWVSDADNDNARRLGGPLPRGGGGRTFGALALKDDPEAIAAAQLCPIRFQGQWEDDETGLFYNRFRHYDPISSQYSIQDPTRLKGGLRIFGYVKNPSFWIDPLGLAGKTIATGGSGQKYISGTNPVEGYGHVPDNQIRSAGEAAGWNPRSAGYLDRGKPGSFYCCHAEQKAYMKGERDISVDKDMCPSCQSWFDKVTKNTGEPATVRDPTTIRNFPK